jgi:uncharacterized protein YcnI
MKLNRRHLVVLPTAATAMLLTTGQALAHVHVDSNEAAAGATDVTLTFTVPNEEASAKTTQLHVVMPADHPLSGVTAVPQDGWTPQVDAGSITWTGGSISGTGEVQFKVSVAKLPSDAESLTFKVLQTYDSGQVVSWIETAPDGSAEPEHPAPVLKLGAAATGGTHSHEAAAAAPAVTAVTGTPVAPETSTGTGWGAVGGIGGGAAVLLAAGFALFRRRKPSTGGTAEASDAVERERIGH